MLGFYTLNLISCIRKCPPVPPYWDYGSISMESNSSVFSTGDTLKIRLVWGDVEYLTKQENDFSITPSLYALSCVEAGDGGPKHPTERIEIYSDADFDSLHLAGELLNDLFLVPEWDYPSINYVPLPYADIRQIFEQHYYVTQYKLICPAIPTLDKNHSLTLVTHKSNGTQVTSEISNLSWQ